VTDLASYQGRTDEQAIAKALFRPMPHDSSLDVLLELVRIEGGEARTTARDRRGRPVHFPVEVLDLVEIGGGE
jgi:hypothetical protein